MRDSVGCVAVQSYQTIHPIYSEPTRHWGCNASWRGVFTEFHLGRRLAAIPLYLDLHRAETSDSKQTSLVMLPINKKEEPGNR